MAIIKCPECGHSVSDQAPTCPSCGVEIAGKITKCPQCGNVYFSSNQQCPFCKTSTGNTPQPSAPTQASQPAVKPSGKKGKGVWIAAAIIAIIVVGGVFFFYSTAQSDQETEAYEYALTSGDMAVLESYLENYASAPQAHRDSIKSHLELLKSCEAEWADAIVSGSKEAIEKYMEKYPNSIHGREATQRIDSLDWLTAVKANTAAAYQTYIDAHANGDHIEEAMDAMRNQRAKTVSIEEQELVKMVLRRFFQSINMRDENALTATVADFLSSFLGSTDVPKSSVVTFMNKIYKDDILSMTWRINDDITISKREVGMDEYEYTVQFSATQDINRTDTSKEQHCLYKIEATINPDSKISAMNMRKIIQ